MKKRPQEQTNAEWLADYDKRDKEPKEMKVSDTGGADFKILDAGSHAAVCTQIIGIGPQETPWGDKEKVKVRFEVPSERVEWEKDGVKHDGPMVIWATYTASLSEKANLRQDLESWRGRAFTKDELAGFEMDALLEVPCMLSVVHRESNGKTYANIANISGLPKGMSAPKAEGDIVSFDPRLHSQEAFNALPEWLQERVKSGLAIIQRQEDEAQGFAQTENPAEGVEDCVGDVADGTGVPF